MRLSPMKSTKMKRTSPKMSRNSSAERFRKFASMVPVSPTSLLAVGGAHAETCFAEGTSDPSQPSAHRAAAAANPKAAGVAQIEATQDCIESCQADAIAPHNDTAAR